MVCFVIIKNNRVMHVISNQCLIFIYIMKCISGHYQF